MERMTGNAEQHRARTVIHPAEGEADHEGGRHLPRIEMQDAEQGGADQDGFGGGSGVQQTTEDVTSENSFLGQGGHDNEGERNGERMVYEIKQFEQ